MQRWLRALIIEVTAGILAAVLLERGIVIGTSRRQLELCLADLLDSQGEPPAALSAGIQLMIDGMRLKWAELEGRFGALTAGSVAPSCWLKQTGAN